jgi:hypothetical protein
MSDHLDGEPREFLTTAELATFLRVSVRTIERLRALGDGPAFVKVLGAYRYRKTEIDRWLAELAGRADSVQALTTRRATPRELSPRRPAASLVGPKLGEVGRKHLEALSRPLDGRSSRWRWEQAAKEKKP